MTNSPRLRAVVFDLDGLIVNTEDLYEEVIDQMLHRRGKAHDRRLRTEMMGRPLLESFRVLAEYHALPDSIEDLAAECRELLARRMARSLTTMPGFNELAAGLDVGRLPYAVATSGTRTYAEDVLTRLNLLQRFRFVLTAEDVEHGKPAPDVYLLAAERLGLPPHQTMVLEDSGNGCRAGVAAGAFTVAVPNVHTLHHDFAGARFVADTLADPRISDVLSLT